MLPSQNLILLYIIFVNIWNKENDGKLRLTRQKPILKDTFKEMEKSNNFSLISNIKTKNFLGENFYKSNVFVPQTPRPVGGVGSTGLDQSNIRQNYLEDNNNLLPYLGSEVWKNMFHPNTTVFFLQRMSTDYFLHSKISSKNSDQRLNTPASVMKLVTGGGSSDDTAASQPTQYLHQGTTCIE